MRLPCPAPRILQRLEGRPWFVTFPRHSGAGPPSYLTAPSAGGRPIYLEAF